MEGHPLRRVEGGDGGKGGACRLPHRSCQSVGHIAEPCTKPKTLQQQRINNKARASVRALLRFDCLLPFSASRQADGFEEMKVWGLGLRVTSQLNNLFTQLSQGKMNHSESNKSTKPPKITCLKSDYQSPQEKHSSPRKILKPPTQNLDPKPKPSTCRSSNINKQISGSPTPNTRTLYIL